MIVEMIRVKRSMTSRIFFSLVLCGLVALLGCQSVGASIPLSELAQVSTPTATTQPATATPFPPTIASVATVPPPPTATATPVVQRLIATATSAEARAQDATRSAADLIANLAPKDGPPTFSSDAGTGIEPLPSITASPTPTPNGTWQPPFQDGPTTVRGGTQFGYTVAQNRNLDTVKIGFHVGPGGNMDGLTQWMEALDAQGIPFFLKSVDTAGPLLEAQELAKRSGVPHILVYRRAGGWYELPNYNDSPQASAREHWALHTADFPPELDPNYVWLETMNEVDRNRSDWLGAFAVETGQLALRDGYKWAAFGWSSGEPEYTDWLEPNMADFLRLAGQHPDRIAVALHEYSFINEDLMLNYPFQVGRFQLLFLAADRLSIPRPTVLITEFGWEYQSVPKPEVALDQLQAAASLYATYPQIKGAAIWYLGPGFGGVARETQRLIAPTQGYIQSTYFERPLYKPIEPELFRDYWEMRGIEP